MFKALNAAPASSRVYSRLSEAGPLLLAVIGMGYPVARIVLPGTISVAMLTPLLLLLFWVVWRATHSTRTIRSPLALPLLLVAIALAASGLFGVAPVAVRVASMFHWASVGVLLFLTIDMLANGWKAQYITWAALVMSSTVLLLGVAELLLWAGQWLLLWQPGTELFPVRFHRPIADILTIHAAILINLGVPLAIAAAWRAPRGRWRALWVGWLLLATLVLFFTSSRGGWIGTATAAGVITLPLLWSAWRAHQWRRVRGIVVVGACCAGLFFGLFFATMFDVAAQRLGGTSSEDLSAGQVVQGLTTSTHRTTFWDIALQFFSEHPVLGVGPGGYKTLYVTEDLFSRIFLPADPHSIYLGILSEGGLAVAASLLLLLVTAVYVGWKGWQRATPLAVPGDASGESGRLLLLSCGAVGASMLIHGLVEVPPTAIIGMGLYIMAAGLTPAGAWKLAGTEEQSIAWHTFGRIHPLHLALVGAAIAAWIASIGVLMQRSDRTAVQVAAATAIQQGDPERAVALYNELLQQHPDYGPAYTGRSVALAWAALEDEELLPLALAAQQQASTRDRTNVVAPVNQGALLLALGQTTEGARVLRAFIEDDRTNWAAPTMLLARMHEQQGDTALARDYWQQIITDYPRLSESAACLASDICPHIPLPTSPYAALQEVQAMGEHPTTADMQRIEELATYWDSTDLWTVGAQVAHRAGYSYEQTRFLTAAVDRAKNYHRRKPTQRLVIVLLDEALQREDQATVRTLVQQWIALPSMKTVPQVSSLQVTTTERDLARALVAAAATLDDPALLEQAENYQARIEAAFVLLAATP